MATEEELEVDREEARQWLRRKMELVKDYPLHAYLRVEGSKVWLFVQYIFSNPTRYPVLHKMVQDDLDTDSEVYTRVTIDDFVNASIDDEGYLVDDFPWEELESAATRYTTLMTCAATEAKYKHDGALNKAEYDYLFTGKRIPHS